MKTYLYYFLFFIPLSLLSSCDYVYNVKIENKSSGSIGVTVFYDRQELDSIYKFNVTAYNAYLESTVNKATLPLHIFDSINLTAKYIIPRNANLVIENGMNGIPDYILIKKIEINKNNKTITYNNKSFDTLFKQKEERLWELEIW